MTKLKRKWIHNLAVHVVNLPHCKVAQPVDAPQNIGLVVGKCNVRDDVLKAFQQRPH